MRPISKPIMKREEAQAMVDGVKSAKNKVIDKVSDLMSYPARRNAQKAILKADKQVQEIKQRRVDKQSLQQEALKNFKPPNMKGFKSGVGVGP